MHTAVHSTAEQSVAIRLLLACGAIGPLLFIVVFLIEGATRPHYNVWKNAISALSLGEGGWMQRTNFIVFGVLLLGFAIGLRLLLRAGRGSTWGPTLFGIFGLCLIGAGIFVTDPGPDGYPPGAPNVLTVHGDLHNLLSLVGFVALIAACFVLARRDAADLSGRGWVWYSVATGLLVAVLFVLTSVVEVLSGPAGLVQRMAIIVGWSWIALLAIRLMRKQVALT